MNEPYHRKYDRIEHRMVYGKQGCGKDLLIVAWLYWLVKETQKTIYSNSPLSFTYKPIRTVKDIEDARNGVLYLHDMDLLFNSRDFILKRNQSKQESLLELVNNMRKHGLQLIGSCHRPRNIDVKLRTLISYWINPRLVRVGPDDTNLWHYVIYYDVMDEYGKYLYSAKMGDLPVYADKYDTYDCVKALG